MEGLRRAEVAGVERGGESGVVSAGFSRAGGGRDYTSNGSDNIFVALSLVEEGGAEEYGVGP